MTEQPTKSRAPWKTILLVISLGLNLLVVGIVAGAFLSGGGSGKGGFSRVASHIMPLGPYGRALSKEDRAEVRRALEGRKSWFKKTRGDMREAGQDMVAAMRREPFQIEDVSMILGRQADVQSSFQAEGRRLLLERISAMSEDQRREFAQNLEEGLNRRRR